MNNNTATQSLSNPTAISIAEAIADLVPAAPAVTKWFGQPSVDLNVKSDAGTARVKILDTKVLVNSVAAAMFPAVLDIVKPATTREGVSRYKGGHEVPVYYISDTRPARPGKARARKSIVAAPVVRTCVRPAHTHIALDEQGVCSACGF